MEGYRVPFRGCPEIVIFHFPLVGKERARSARLDGGRARPRAKDLLICPHPDPPHSLRSGEGIFASSGTPAKNGREKPIRARGMAGAAEEFAHARRRVGGDDFAPDFGGRTDGEIRMADEERRDSVLVFAGEQRARGIDDATAGGARAAACRAACPGSP